MIVEAYFLKYEMIYKDTFERKHRKIANIRYGLHLTVCKLASDNKSMKDSSTTVVWKETVREAVVNMHGAV